MSYLQWPNGVPPLTWPRVLAVDVGGSTPWGWLWSAIDPDHNIVFYDEIYRATNSADTLVDEALPRMKHAEGEYQWIAKVIDYENKVAAEDLRRRGITMTNARKIDKASSIERLKGYLHPNPKHHYPEWHPLAGRPGSPRCFVTAKCKNLRREFPQARWLERTSAIRDEDKWKDEMDRRSGNHLIDCALYTVRELPPPFDLKPAPPRNAAVTVNKSKISELYWFDRARHEEDLARANAGVKRISLW